ncbi:MAG: endonuclease/exonuclease/phosphatase family protein [Thermogutta sp.]|nr:endonuclease/exonuclease/phosphatase family protein [Thermogutta sp.]
MAVLLMPGFSSVQSEESPLRVRVLTFNIRYGTASDGPNHWSHRKDLVIDLIKRGEYDFVGLQEALRFQIDEIRQALPHFQEIGVGREDGKQAGEYSAILYDGRRLRVVEQDTFWLSDTPAVPGSKTWGNNIPRIVTWGRFAESASGRELYVFNTHFDHQSQPSREKSAALLADRLAQRDPLRPVVVTGDFNAAEDNPAIRLLKGETAGSPIRLLDTFRLLHPEAKDVGTFHGFRGGTSGGKIDYVFVEPGAKVIRAEILHDSRNGQYPSDHYPVMAEIEWPGTTN